jgi:hypothetical protein
MPDDPLNGVVARLDADDRGRGERQAMGLADSKTVVPWAKK